MRKLILILKDDGSAAITDENNNMVRDNIPSYEVEAFLTDSNGYQDEASKQPLIEFD